MLVDISGSEVIDMLFVVILVGIVALLTVSLLKLKHHSPDFYP